MAAMPDPTHPLRHTEPNLTGAKPVARAVGPKFIVSCGGVDGHAKAQTGEPGKVLL